MSHVQLRGDVLACIYFPKQKHRFRVVSRMHVSHGGTKIIGTGRTSGFSPNSRDSRSGCRRGVGRDPGNLRNVTMS
jgi:hypothetical protein